MCMLLLYAHVVYVHVYAAAEVGTASRAQAVELTRTDKARAGPYVLVQHVTLEVPGYDVSCPFKQLKMAAPLATFCLSCSFLADRSAHLSHSAFASDFAS